MKIDLSGALHKSLENAKKEFSEAKKKNDVDTAREKALECASILRQIAAGSGRRSNYLDQAERWENIAQVKDYTKPKSRKRNNNSQPKSGETESSEDDFSSQVENLISKSSVIWNDIGGLEEVKMLMMETIAIAGLQKPDSIKPWKGILLFGPPGTGKTLLAAAAAGSLDATFYDVKSDKVLSKYFGESSKLVSSLFNSARERAPSIVFVDEFDALSQARGEGMGEATRKVLSSLLTELDGMQDKKSDRLVLTLAATNTPWDLDPAVLSRFPRRIYVTLPDKHACSEILKIHTKDLDISKIDIDSIASECIKKRYSGRDLQNLCQQAMWNMIKDMNKELYKLAYLKYEELNKRKLDIRPLKNEDFKSAFEKITTPVSEEMLKKYERWNKEFGEI